jgi:hypothetical protein
MSKTEFSLGSIETLDDFYKEYDKKAIELKKSYDLLEPLLQFKKKSTDEEVIQKLQWEIEASLFEFRGSRLFSFSSSNGNTIGEIQEYPDLNEYQKVAFNFLANRAMSSQSAYLRAKYNFLLWHSIVKKTNVYAKNASENYIEAINECLIKTKNEEDYSYLIGRIVENLLSIVSESKQNISESKLLIETLLKSDTLNFWAKHGIIDDMLKYPKLFKAQDFTLAIPIFNERIKISTNKLDDFSLINYHLPTAIKVAEKTKTDIKIWYEEVGKANLRLAEQETEDNRNWIKLDYYRAAIDAYRISGNKARKEQIEQSYFELKPNVKLDTFRIDFDEETIKKLKESQNEIKEFALSLLKVPPEIIFVNFANGKYYPKIEDVRKASKENKADFLDFAVTLQFDNNKNNSRKTAKDEEKSKLLETYGMRIKETFLPFMHYFFVYGIKSGHLTTKTLLNYFINYTWIGKPHTKIDLGGELETSNWIFQIAPSINEFFTQVLAWGESKYYSPNFILCIDSLTLKIEGLFRNFSERLNVSTSKGKRNGVQEALAHDIMNNETIRKYFNEEDILLFDYVFSNEGGLNLRNNIAHSFYSENEYHPDKMLLLLAVLFRLGKYNIEERR